MLQIDVRCSHASQRIEPEAQGARREGYIRGHDVRHQERDKSKNKVGSVISCDAAAQRYKGESATQANGHFYYICLVNVTTCIYLH